MRIHTPKLLLVLLIVLVVITAGCEDNRLLKQFAGHHVGVYVDSDSEFPGFNSKTPISFQIITSKLADSMNKNHWIKLTATAILSPDLQEMDIQAEDTRTQLCSDLSLDNLLLINILEVKPAVSMGAPVSLYLSYDVLLEYQIFEKDAPDPIFRGNGVAEIREKFFDPRNLIIRIPDSEKLITNAILLFLGRLKNE